MTALRALLVLALLHALMAAPAPADSAADPTLGEDEPLVDLMEVPCLQSGGLCMLESECLPELRANSSSLCPEQAARGVRCCYGLPISETRCRSRGGECWSPDSCGGAPRDPLAIDCAVNEVCCIAVV